MINRLLSVISGVIIPSWLKLLLTGLAAAGIFSAGWAVNGWRLELTVANLEKAAIQAGLDFERYATTLKVKYEDQLRTARDNAIKREVALRAEAASARRAADKLRDNLHTANRQVSELSATACHERVIAVTNVFESCVGRLTEMAESCDRHLSDKQTLIDGWPGN